jgi:hypothetical protein
MGRVSGARQGVTEAARGDVKEHLANIEQNVYVLIIPQAVGVAVPELPAQRSESWNKAIIQ